jgi:hypothetical protein
MAIRLIEFGQWIYDIAEGNSHKYSNEILNELKDILQDAIDEIDITIALRKEDGLE